MRVILFFTVFALICVFLSSGSDASAFSTRGCEGQEVLSVQHALRALGYYSGACDGIYSKKLEDAVKAWQGSKSIPQTGVCAGAELAMLGVDEKTPLENEGEILSLASFVYEIARGEPRTCKISLCATVINSAKRKNIPVLWELSRFSEGGAYFDDECLRCAFEAFIGCDPTGGAVFFSEEGEDCEFVKCRKKTAAYGSFSFYF